MYKNIRIILKPLMNQDAEMEIKDAKTIAIRDSVKVKADVMEFLLRLPLFKGFEEEELSMVANHMYGIEIKKDEILFKEGDRGDFVCFVDKGKLEILKMLDSGEEVKMAELGEGTSIGEMAIIDEMPRSASVKAMEDSVIILLLKKRFDYISLVYPQIGIKILNGISRMLSINMRETTRQLAECKLKLSKCKYEKLAGA